MQLELPMRVKKPSQNERLESLFRSRPNEWLPMTDLGRAIGAWAVHSRVADLRAHGMDIENRTQKDDGETLSFYRFNAGVTH